MGEVDFLVDEAGVFRVNVPWGVSMAWEVSGGEHDSYADGIKLMQPAFTYCTHFHGLRVTLYHESD